MKNMNWILVAVDCSSDARLALEAADDQAARAVYLGRGGALEVPGPVAEAVRAALPGKVELVSRLASRIYHVAA